MKIIHLITDLDVGGAEVMLFNLVKEHLKKNMDMYVIALSGKGIIGEKIKKLGIPVTILGMIPGKLDILKLFLLVKKIRKIKPDIIQTWMYHADLAGSVAAPLSGNPPVVWGLHHTLGDPSYVKKDTRIIIKLNSILSRWIPKKIICCSKATMESHGKEGYAWKKMVVIQNGIDLDLFVENADSRVSLRHELKLSTDIKLIGMIARFHPQKDHRTLIKAAELLHEKFPQVHFVLSGKDIQPENIELLGWIKAAGLEDNFHLLGIRSDIPLIVAALDLVTLSSAYGEAMPLSICEAMSCGIPCVVTDVGDSCDIVGQAGICVQPLDSIALSEGWIKLLSLDTEEFSLMKINARRRIINKFNLVRVSEMYFNEYMRVI